MVSPDILSAFGLSGNAIPLNGGQGSSWRVDDFVLKPQNESYEGISLMIDQLKPKNFRISYHQKSKNGTYLYQGWGCTRFEPGEDTTGRIREKYAVARELHDCFEHIEKPANWHPYGSPWSRAHQFVWGECDLPPDIHPEIASVINTFQKYLKPIAYANQIIHGDLCGNILFHSTLPPLVIDFSLDFRPREYAEAILIADSIAWEGGGKEAWNLLPSNSEQILLRACLFRLATKAFLKPQNVASFRKESAEYQAILKKLSPTKSLIQRNENCREKL